MALNNLRDKLLQAGLVNEDEVARAEAEEASRRAARKGKRKAKGKARSRGDAKPAPAEARLSPEELAAAEAKRAEREKKQALERERAENRKRAARERAIAEDVRRVADALGVETGGDRVFFFPDRKGRIQRLLVTEAVETALSSGEMAIIEHPLPHAIEHAVVPREGAEAVLKIHERAVRFYNRAPGETYGAAPDAPPAEPPVGDGETRD